MSTTSPSQQGVEGTDAQEVWIITEESVILVISTSLFGKICILPHRRHILCLLATFQRLVAQFVGSSAIPAQLSLPPFDGILPHLSEPLRPFYASTGPTSLS